MLWPSIEITVPCRAFIAEYMIYDGLAMFESISKGAGRVDHALFESNYLLVRELSKGAVGRIVHPRWEGLSYRLLNKSVCLSVCCLSVPLSPSGREGGPQTYLYRYTDYAFNRQSVHLSVCSSRGRSRYIDISMIYILSKLKY